jgi:hypothetical protein
MSAVGHSRRFRPHQTMSVLTPITQIGDPLRRSKRAKSGIQLYPQSSEGKSSHYEATNIRCVYYKEEPKPDTMERRENVRTKTPRLCTSAK